MSASIHPPMISLEAAIAELRQGGEISNAVADALEQGVTLADILVILARYDGDPPAAH